MSSLSASPSNSKRRATAATQACETCRKRKTKCDQQRPRCSLCRRLSVECQYKDPPPVKRDETMVNILATLQRMEARFNSLPSAGDLNTSSRAQPSGESILPNTPFSGYSSDARSSRSAPIAYNEQTSPFPFPQNPSHLTLPHKILLWPSIRSQLISSGSHVESDLNDISAMGTPWLIKQALLKYPQGLHFDIGTPAFISNVVPGESQYSLRAGASTLTSQQIQRYSDAYFNTFNLLYPVLEYTNFTEGILAPLLVKGFGLGDHASVLALLVFALGELAINGISGTPIADLHVDSSGIRGGTAKEPPGLGIFNEARLRTGSIALQCGLMDVQIQLLQGIYFEANGCHVEYWRSTVAASLACQLLLKCSGIQLSSPEDDLIRRVYWTCAMNEDLYHIDLDLPRTEICDFEDKVPFPQFREIKARYESTEGTYLGPETQYYFLAMIALRNIISRIHEAIHLNPHQPESPEDYNGPPVHVMLEMARQLDSWHAFLPASLQWSDEELLNPSPHDQFDELSPERACGLGILQSELRTRYYYARFILYRPFVFKALHYPEQMNDQDAESCTYAVKSACLWPMAMAPTRKIKRLVPHLFTRSQNFIGVLIILWMSLNDERFNFANMAQLDRDRIQQAITLTWEWVEDIKQIDGIAEWSWHVLGPLLSRSL